MLPQRPAAAADGLGREVSALHSLTHGAGAARAGSAGPGGGAERAAGRCYQGPGGEGVGGHRDEVGRIWWARREALMHGERKRGELRGPLGPAPNDDRFFL